jgi:hypothetical protein
VLSKSKKLVFIPIILIHTAFKPKLIKTNVFSK